MPKEGLAGWGSANPSLGLTPRTDYKILFYWLHILYTVLYMYHICFSSSLRNTYKTLFWTLFNYGDPEFANIVVGNNHTDDKIVKHKLTEATGYFIYGAYNVVSVIVLLNMLIAMMARSYSIIEVSIAMMASLTHGLKSRDKI